jgi:uncharacterized protein
MSSLFTDPTTLLTGALTGLAFGFLLQRGGVTRYRVILGQFLLRDHTVLKTMLTAIVVGSIGIYGMRAVGFEVALHIKTAALMGNLLGGLIFGVGMAVLGHCPGTVVGALAEGSRQAWFGILGMLAGAAAYAEVYPWFKAAVLTDANLGKATLDSVTGLPVELLVAVVTVLGVVGLGAIQRFERRPAGTSPT